MRRFIVQRDRIIRGGLVSAVAVFFCACLPAEVAARGPEVVRVRHFSAPDHTRIVLDLSGPGSFEVRRVTDPDRIAINVRGANLARTATIAVGDGVVKRIRSNPGRGRAQVVLDLDHRSEFRSFSLPAGSGRPDRIVVDVLRGVAAEPSPRKKPPVARPRPAPRAPVVPPATLQPSARPFVVIVDPGHGGLDPGASRGGVREKDVVLDIARETARLIDSVPGYRAILTRTGDYGLELWQRVGFAKEKEGDLFLSIHANTNPRKSLSGMDVYFLSLQGATDREAKELADKENAAQLVGLNPGQAHDDLVMDILMDLRMTQVLHESARLSDHILAAADASGVIAGRKVKQAGFQVLKSLAMPSALIEVGFMTNRNDLALLKKKSGRKALAAVIAEGVMSWRRDQEAIARLGGNPGPLWTREYQVRRGDSLWKLARDHGTTIGEITRRNELASGSLLVGQTLRLPETVQEP